MLASLVGWCVEMQYPQLSCGLQATCLAALLQPAPEVYDLFDDTLLLCDGEHP